MSNIVITYIICLKILLYYGKITFLSGCVFSDIYIIKL